MEEEEEARIVLREMRVGRSDLADSGKGKITGLDKGNRDMSTEAGSRDFISFLCLVVVSDFVRIPGPCLSVYSVRES